MSQYLVEFAALMGVHFLLVIVPGADFALVVRQAVVHGRKAAIATSFGMGCSLLFHISYTVLGLGVIVSQSLLLFGLLKWAGAAYLIYLGVRSLFERAPVPLEIEAATSRGLTPLKCFLMGFAANALNPKPVLFFLSLFSVLVSPETPLAIQAVYGLFMAASLILWFVGVSAFFTVKAVRDRFTALGKWFNRATGAALIGLGVKLAIARVGE